MILHWYQKWTRTQTLVILPSMITLSGIFATLFGAGAAESFAYYSGAQGYIARISGVLMMSGGALTLLGMKKGDMFWETLGLLIGSAGTAIYAIGTVIGFGTGGTVSGLMSMGVSLVLMERVLFAVAEARARRAITEGDDDDNG